MRNYHGSRLSLFSCLLLFCLASCTNPAEDEREANPKRPSTDRKVSVLVAYYSLSGNTKKMARAVVEGAKRVEGATVEAKAVDQVTKEDLQKTDALILGSPTYYATIPGKMKTVIDDWAWKMRVDFTNKVGGAFATGGGQTAGKEHVVISLLLYMLNNRMVVAGPLYENEKGDDKWGEIGAAAMTGPIDPGVGAKEEDGARRLGERIANLALKMKGK